MYGYYGTLGILINSLVVVLVLFIFARLMGKKQISQLTFFDFIIGIAIGSVAATLAVGNISFTTGIVSLIILVTFPILLSYISLKSESARKFLDGTPTILVQNGKIMEENLKKSRLNTNDILEELRFKSAFNLADVEFAILETTGNVSVQLKSQKQPVTPSDLSIPTQYRGLSANLILDGQIKYDNLKLVQLDESWLMNELKKEKILSPSEVLLATLDTTGQLHVDKRNSDPISMKVVD